jgi:hypothetical protein
MSITTRHVAYAAVTVLALFAVAKSATLRYREKEDAIRQEARAQLQKLGISQAEAKAKYPTPQIRLVSSGCLTPGGTGEVVVQGKFSPGTKFVLESDSVEVVKENLTGTEYRATVRIAPNIPPHNAQVIAISPVSGISDHNSPGVLIGGRTEWDMQAANGWRIVARSPANKRCDGTSAEDAYQVQFFRKGETAAFETRSARGHYEAYDSTEYFTIGDMDTSAASQQERFQELMMKMSDPKLSPSEREKVTAELQKAQEQMLASMKNAVAAAQQAQEKRKQFGCERIELKLQATSVQGTMRCSEAVGTRIGITGTMKSLGR